MKRDWKFDESFLEQKIKEGKLLLEKENISEELKTDIGMMIENFSDYLGDWQLVSGSKKIETPISEKCKALTEKFQKDLDKMNLNCWNAMHMMCSNYYKVQINNENVETCVWYAEEIVENVLNFYRNLDSEFYLASKKIINNSIPLINLATDDAVEDHCFVCNYLKFPFINVCINNEMADVWFTHEIQHGIDYTLYKRVPYLFSEVASLFSETIYIDSLNKPKFYNDRLINIIKDMKMVYDYVEILHRFIEHGNEVNIFNIDKILDCNNEKDLLSKYDELMFYNYLEVFKYVLDFLLSVELRKIYYNNRKEGVKKLKAIISNKDITADFDSLGLSFDDYLKEIDYVKRR